MCVSSNGSFRLLLSSLSLSLTLFVFFLILVSRPHRIIKTNNTSNAANIHINHWQFVGSQNDVDTIQLQLKLCWTLPNSKRHLLTRSIASSTNRNGSCTQSNQENLFAIYLHFSIQTWESNTYKYFNCRRRRRRCRRGGTHWKCIEVLHPFSLAHHTLKVVFICFANIK